MGGRYVDCELVIVSMMSTIDHGLLSFAINNVYR